MSTGCGACDGKVQPYREVQGHWFVACDDCGLLQIEPATMQRIDAGEPVFEYADSYWSSEVIAARERAWGVGIARAAEVFLCARRPVQRFLDIGTGPGYFLDAISTLAPHLAGMVHGIELFPPSEEARSRHPNYRLGRLGDYPPNSFDAGLCMEVFEHLTPRMVQGLLAELAKVFRTDACVMVNTGLAAFAREEDPGYLDPLGRGHITAWTLKAVNHLAQPLGLVASPLPGRSWCFLLEKTIAPALTLEARLASVLPENRAALAVPGTPSSALAIMAEQSLWGSYHYDQFLSRTRWALSMSALLEAARATPVLGSVTGAATRRMSPRFKARLRKILGLG